MKRRLVLLSIAAAIVAGCGSDDDDAAAPVGGAQVKIVETEFALEPDRLDADAGEATIRVANNGQVTHALEVEGGDVEEETDEIPPGESAELTVELEPGKYELYCPIGNHREQGMEGTLVVGGGADGTDTDQTETDETETNEDSGYGG